MEIPKYEEGYKSIEFVNFVLVLQIQIMKNYFINILKKMLFYINVFIFGKKNYKFCKIAKELFQIYKLDYQYKNIDTKIIFRNILKILFQIIIIQFQLFF